MIVAVEGPSAAGKTTWCSQQIWPTVPEHALASDEPPPHDITQRAAYWVDVNARRWQHAVSLEQSSAIVLCDSDPLKLHYSWCLARVGAASWDRFDEELQHVRQAFFTKRLGLTDLALVLMPPVGVLRRRREDDATRLRRAFELHMRLREPLREWYSAVDAADPGRVVWSPRPATSIVTTHDKRPDRYDAAVLDRIIARLPQRRSR